MGEGEDNGNGKVMDKDDLLLECMELREKQLVMTGRRENISEEELREWRPGLAEQSEKAFGSVSAFLEEADKEYNKLYPSTQIVQSPFTETSFDDEDSSPSPIMQDMVPSSEGSMMVFDDNEAYDSNAGMFSDFDNQEEDRPLAQQDPTTPYAIALTDDIPPGEEGERLKSEVERSGGVITDSGRMRVEDAEVPRHDIPSKTEQGLPFITPDDLEKIASEADSKSESPAPIRPANVPPAPEDELVMDDRKTMESIPMTYDDLAPTGRTVQGMPPMEPAEDVVTGHSDIQDVPVIEAEELGIRRDTDTEMLDPMKHLRAAGGMLSDAVLAEAIGSRSADEPAVAAWDNRDHSRDPVAVDRWNAQDYSVQERPVVVAALPDTTEEIQEKIQKKIQAPPVEPEISDAVDSAFEGDAKAGLSEPVPEYVAESAAPLGVKDESDKVIVNYSELGEEAQRIIAEEKAKRGIEDLSAADEAPEEKAVSPPAAPEPGYMKDIKAPKKSEPEGTSVDEGFIGSFLSGKWFGRKKDDVSTAQERLEEQVAEASGSDRQITQTSWSTVATRRAGVGASLVLAGGIAIGGIFAYLASDDNQPGIDAARTRGAETALVEQSNTKVVEHRLSKNISVVLPEEREDDGMLGSAYDDDRLADDVDRSEEVFDLQLGNRSKRATMGSAVRPSVAPVPSRDDDLDDRVDAEHPAGTGPDGVDAPFIAFNAAAARSGSHSVEDSVAPSRADDVRPLPVSGGVDVNCSFRAKMRFSSTAYTDRTATMDALEQYVLAAVDAGNTEFIVYGIASIESQDDRDTVGRPVRDDDRINRYLSTVRGNVGKRDIERILRRNGRTGTVRAEQWNEVTVFGGLADNRGYVVAVNAIGEHPDENAEVGAAVAQIDAGETCGVCAARTASADIDPDTATAYANSLDDDGDDQRSREVIEAWFGDIGDDMPAEDGSKPLEPGEFVMPIHDRLSDDYDMPTPDDDAFDLLDDDSDDSRKEVDIKPDYRKMVRDINREYKATMFGSKNVDVHSLSRENFSEEFETKHGYSCSWEVAAMVYTQVAMNEDVDGSVLDSLLVPSEQQVTMLDESDILEMEEADTYIDIDVQDPVTEMQYTLNELAESIPEMQTDDVSVIDIHYSAELEEALQEIYDMPDPVRAAETEATLNRLAIMMADDQVAETGGGNGNLYRSDRREAAVNTFLAEQTLEKLAEQMGYDADGNSVNEDERIAELEEATLARLEHMMRCDVEGNSVLPPADDSYDAVSAAHTEAALARIEASLEADQGYNSEMALARLDRKMERQYSAEEAVEAQASEAGSAEQSGVYFAGRLFEVDDEKVAVLGDVSEQELDAAFTHLMNFEVDDEKVAFIGDIPSEDFNQVARQMIDDVPDRYVA